MVTQEQLVEGVTLVTSRVNSGLCVVHSAWETACSVQPVIHALRPAYRWTYWFYKDTFLWEKSIEAYYRQGRQDRALSLYLTQELGEPQHLEQGMHVSYQNREYVVAVPVPRAYPLWYIDPVPVAKDVHDLVAQRTYIHPNQVERV